MIFLFYCSDWSLSRKKQDIEKWHFGLSINTTFFTIKSALFFVCNMYLLLFLVL